MVHYAFQVGALIPCSTKILAEKWKTSGNVPTIGTLADGRCTDTWQQQFWAKIQKEISGMYFGLLYTMGFKPIDL